MVLVETIVVLVISSSSESYGATEYWEELQYQVLHRGL